MSLFQDIKIEGQAGSYRVNVFGKNTDIDNADTADLWDLESQDIWLAPTAARLHAIVSSSDTDICGLGTFTVGTNPSNTNTVTIGSKVYLFLDTVGTDDGNVHIGANASASIDNLIAAINLGSGAGTDYGTNMTANAVLTTAAVGAGDTMRLFDLASTNAATTETLGNGSWGSGNTIKGVSARTIRIYGLKTWSSRETTEDINLFGTTSQNTANSYVMINKIEVLTAGDTSRNAGVIKATAASDSTITAQINAVTGITQMAIYGVGTGYKLQLTDYFGSVIKPSAALACTFTLLMNPEPADAITYNNIHEDAINTVGSTKFQHFFGTPKEIVGPCIVKLQANGTVDGNDMTGGFSGVVTQTALLDFAKI